jgi:hypothetical protein
MDIVVVEIPDVWGMLLSRKFASKLGGTLEIDLSYVNIPLKDRTVGRLRNIPVTTTHVQECYPPLSGITRRSCLEAHRS